MSKLTISCPRCRKLFEYKKSKSRPFCSERCKLADLINWTDEKYIVSSKIDDQVIQDDIDIDGDTFQAIIEELPPSKLN